jgi:sugar transferase EpsL
MIMVRNSVKRILDVIFSVVVLVMLSPLLLVLSVAVLIIHGPPIIFKQVRPGLHGKPFTIYKFRTMKNLYGPTGSLLPNEDRLTRFGKWLRATSLDELPEFVNVLIGDMSVVGPRPLRLQYMDRYTPEQARRHEVRPGITGWAQVNGRNALTWEEKFVLDVWYVDNWNLLLDFKILFMTIAAVIKRDGINAEGHVTMPEFMGSLSEPQNCQVDNVADK